ncbi:MAG TPA: MATE family efflux transporter [Candidatus Fimivivens faecavium]|nr:MATE family efflux transporter [Candidatus Fimivivens faecavium]
MVLCHSIGGDFTGRRNALTEGDVFLTLLQFSIPFLLSSLLQALYGASDLFMVGRFADSAGVCAVATGGQVMQTIASLAIGLTTGGTVLVAKHIGAKNRREAAHAVKTALAVFGVLSLALTVLVLLMAGPICALMQVPAEASAVARRYLTICAFGIVFIIGFNVVSGILRGMGDSRTPLLFMAAACLINVSTDLLFVGVLGLGAPGAAVSTVLAQAAALALSAAFLLRRGTVGRYRRLRPSFRPGAARELLGVGVPVALQEGLVNVSFLIITSIVNGTGLYASAAVGIVEKLIMFSMLPATAFSAAVAAMTAQNAGAGLDERGRRCLRGGVSLSLLFGLAFFACAQVNSAGLVSVFTGDQNVVLSGMRYLRAYSADSVIVCFVFCINAYLSGCGHPSFPLLHSLAATFLIRIPLSWLFSRTGSMFLIGTAAPAASLFSLLLCFWFLHSVADETKACTGRRIRTRRPSRAAKSA